MAHSIPNARPAPIGDRELATLRRIAHDSRHSLASQAEAEWLISACGPLLDELATRRAVMNGWPVQPDLVNVVILDAVR